MLKLEIKLDESQILLDKKYKPDSIFAAVDIAFEKYRFRKEVQSDGTIVYYGNGNPKDYGAFGRLITTLKDKEWFIAYATKWIWYNSDDGEDENDFSVEDVLYHYTHRNLESTLWDLP